MKITRKRILILCIVAGFLIGHCSSPFANTTSAMDEPVISLQDVVDKANPGDQIVLSASSYSGPVVIDKPLDIQGSQGVTLINESVEPAITIQSDGVNVQDISIMQKQSSEQSAAIHVMADRVSLRNLNIRTRGFGIVLRHANHSVIEHNNIFWDSSQGPSTLGQKGNGIDLLKSSNNRIAHNTVSNMRDGIYLENSKSLNIMDNIISGSRYGIHCMYIEQTQMVRNIGEYNFTGAMIMGVRDVLVSDNTFAKQRNNVNSQGILLYDVQSSKVTKNVVEGNRVGIYVERSSQNELSNNSVYRNFVGIQLVNSENNAIWRNDFVANVIEAEASDSKENQIEHNFWDAAQTLDTNKDGNSDIQYAINPFYRNLITATPAFQLFFQSPGIAFVSGMYENDRHSWTTDSSPSMKLNHPLLASNPNVTERMLPDKMFLLIIASMLLFISVLTIIYSREAKT